MAAAKKVGKKKQLVLKKILDVCKMKEKQICLVRVEKKE